MSAGRALFRLLLRFGRLSTLLTRDRRIAVTVEGSGLFLALRIPELFFGNIQ